MFAVFCKKGMTLDCFEGYPKRLPKKIGDTVVGSLQVLTHELDSYWVGCLLFNFLIGIQGVFH